MNYHWHPLTRTITAVVAVAKGAGLVLQVVPIVVAVSAVVIVTVVCLVVVPISGIPPVVVLVVAPIVEQGTGGTAWQHHVW